MNKPFKTARFFRPFYLLLVLAVILAVVMWGDQLMPNNPPDRTSSAPAGTEDGEHAYTNRLIDETSPYLLQHAHNPVDWYPWGDEAFEEARREDKLIFLSVGYSTCYWCHVMEKESFEDPEVGAILNEHYVAIKVDREERPDIDEQYMLATQLLRGRGGWPNSVWLTPDGKPWTAATYIPKDNFMKALTQMNNIWSTRRGEVLETAQQVSTAMSRATQLPAGSSTSSIPITSELLSQLVEDLTSEYDPVNGGFGTAPKFPPHGTLAVLAREHMRLGDSAVVDELSGTLDAMWLGGIHDHLGGGFHRYSTDAEWLLPHFEKMLYDNGQLLRAYTDGYLITGNERYRRAVEDIFTWIEREMTSSEGAFYSALDSGEVGKEGEAYVWHYEEIIEILGVEESNFFADVYNVERRGNYLEEATHERTGANVLHLEQPLASLAQERGVDPDDFAARLEDLRSRLLAHRLTWPQPHTDDKVLTSWNGLVIGALAYAGRHLEEPRYVTSASEAASFILAEMRREGVLLRTYRDGTAKIPGYLDDYAYFAQALIELYRTTGEQRWLDAARELADDLLDSFQDPTGGGFFFTTEGHDDLLLRSKNLSGGGNIPNPNGVSVQVLLELWELTGVERYGTAARENLESLAGLMVQSPHNTAHLVAAASTYLGYSGTCPEPSSTDDTGPEDAIIVTRADPVTISAFATDSSIGPGETMEIAIAIDIDDGWHLYSENPEHEFLVPTAIDVEAPDWVDIGEIATPESHPMVDPILDVTVETYTGRIWFRAPLTLGAAAPTGAQTVSFTVRTQACDDSRCLPPTTTTVEVPFEVVE